MIINIRLKFRGEPKMCMFYDDVTLFIIIIIIIIKFLFTYTFSGRTTGLKISASLVF